MKLGVEPGANSTYASGGKGGYNSGLIALKKGEKLYIYALSNSGGSADVRLINGAYDNKESLNSRIMVAGGGGSASNYLNTTSSKPGGAGGGLTGASGTFNTATCSLTAATGGSQTSVGTGAITATDAACKGVSGGNGYFGPGGLSNSGTPTGGYGYYGGGGIGYSNSKVSSAGGGSSFISGYAGVDAITKKGSHTHQVLHYSELAFANATMSQGSWNQTAKATITFYAK